MRFSVLSTAPVYRALRLMRHDREVAQAEGSMTAREEKLRCTGAPRKHRRRSDRRGRTARASGSEGPERLKAGPAKTAGPARGTAMRCRWHNGLLQIAPENAPLSHARTFVGRCRKWQAGPCKFHALSGHATGSAILHLLDRRMRSFVNEKAGRTVAHTAWQGRTAFGLILGRSKPVAEFGQHLFIDHAFERHDVLDQQVR
jgi:hypothetical protein